MGKSDSDGDFCERYRRKKHKTVRFASAIVVISLPRRSTSEADSEVRDSRFDDDGNNANELFLYAARYGPVVVCSFHYTFTFCAP